MKHILVALLLVGMAGSLGAQTANVIELEPADTDQAKQVWKKLQDAESDWRMVQYLIATKYTSRSAKGGKSTLPKGGYEHGFEFSTDFKFIVPGSRGVTGFTIDGNGDMHDDLHDAAPLNLPEACGSIMGVLVPCTAY